MEGSLKDKLHFIHNYTTRLTFHLPIIGLQIRYILTILKSPNMAFSNTNH